MNLKNKGIAIGLFSAILWAMNTIFLSVVEIENILLLPLFLAFSHDFFSSLFLYANLKRLGYKLTKLWNKIHKINLSIIMIAAIFGGPLGMAGYLLSVKYLGPSYSTSISVLYPILGAILGRIFFKEKLTENKKIAIFLSITGIVALTFSFENIVEYPEYKLGILFSLFCVFGWALEGNIASYFMKEEGIASDVAIFIRQATSSLFYIVVFLPWFGGVKGVSTLWFGEKHYIVLLVFTSFLGALSYLFWYKAIDMLGSSIGMLLNSTYVVWVVLIDAFVLKTSIGIKFVFALSMILLSVFILTKEE